MDKPENLSFEDFAKLDLRAGTIVAVEVIPKSKKLLKLEVNFGSDGGTRTILAGIAQASQYGKVVDGVWEDSCMVGTRVVAVLNLAPRTMFEIVSHGMLLAAHDEANGIWLMNPGPVPNGSSVG